MVQAHGTWYGEAPWSLPSWKDKPAPRQTLREVFHYDTDWSVTGPLIEKFKIGVGVPDNEHLIASCGEWYAISPHNYEDGPQEYGETPLIAICRLILALKEAGKL